ncbi:2-oxoglutarate ferredoxin oxidoreductase subunit delta [Tindallia magadiensis]|uniref:2-oxoglutarate ferredoxin oxidoreductase subunit delta n=1 Tax=Tindallia magadiensis TaxID=69895 RepID=A0A1I3FKM5_9FIRM|nr:4Fe-4S binding protein [Tindallia magadiensis]SFI11785.1 2-oxoglutarate ferredoxin oxidoreductase subunit delta [Tindallia magadiensis]
MAKARGRVEFDTGRCKGCALCVIACPVKIVELEKDKINSKGYHPAGVKEMDKCIACTNCATICPDLVISVYKQD